MPDTSKLADVYNRACRDTSRGEANKCLRANGGLTGDPESVPGPNVAQAIAGLERLASDDGDDGNSYAPAKARPQTVSDLHDAAYKKWNQKRTG